jgi:ATP phosphoribosyltransferase
VLDYYFDPALVISTLAKSNVTTIESVLRMSSLQIHNAEFDYNVFRQLPNELLAKIKEIINGASNVTIAPSYVVEEVSMIMFIFFSLLSFFYVRNVKW